MQALITAGTLEPNNEETQRMARLIGRRLTRIEIREGGVVYLEFDPTGAVTIRPNFSQEVFTSVVKGAYGS